MTAGSGKVLVEDFAEANGYNPHFVVGGSEAANVQSLMSKAKIEMCFDFRAKRQN